MEGVVIGGENIAVGEVGVVGLGGITDELAVDVKDTKDVLSDGRAAESSGILEIFEVVIIVERSDKNRDTMLGSFNRGLISVESKISVAGDIADNGNGWHGVIVAHSGTSEWYNTRYGYEES